jgi:hypothetical protein
MLHCNIERVGLSLLRKSVMASLLYDHYGFVQVAPEAVGRPSKARGFWAVLVDLLSRSHEKAAQRELARYALALKAQ